MPQPTKDEIVTKGNVRYFYQPSGPGPLNQLFYGGQDGQYLVIEDQSHPRVGSRSRINVHDPRTPKKYRQVGQSTDPPELSSATVQFMQMHGAVPGHLIGYDCPMNFYQLVGNCKDLSDLLDGATDYWKIFSRGVHESSSEMGGSFDSDEALSDGLDYTFDDIYPIGAFTFGEEGADEVDLEVIDGVYGSRLSCGVCGPDDDGTKLWYGVVINDTGVPPVVVYTTDGFQTVNTVAITGATDATIPVAIDIAGRYLIVVYNDAGGGGYYYAEINDLTGVPGTFTDVTTGFVALSDPNDIWVASPREIWFAADAGYIYKSENVTQGVTPVHEGDVTSEDLLRIMSIDEVLIAGGTNGAFVMSFNRGSSFAAPVVAPTVNDITTVAIYNDYAFWVGDDAGNVYYTLVRGELAWTALITGYTLTAVDDIVWVNSEIGYITAQTSGPVAVMLATFDGGYQWSRSNPLTGRFVTWPVFDRGNRISYPAVDNQGVAANTVVVCGLAGNGTDGIIVKGDIAKIP